MGVEFGEDTGWPQYAGVKCADGVNCPGFNYGENPSTEPREGAVTVLAADGANGTNVELAVSRLGVALPRLSETGTASEIKDLSVDRWNVTFCVSADGTKERERLYIPAVMPPPHAWEGLTEVESPLTLSA